MGSSHLATKSTAHPHSKKKSVPRLAKKALDLSLPPSPSVGDSSCSPSVGNSSDQEPEPTVPFIDLELEKEEKVKDMAPKLKVGFKERHRKHLSEAFPVAPSPTKKVYLKAPS